MVAVHEAASHEEANRLVEILNERAIPALVQSRDVGIRGVIVPEGDRDIWVVVPQAMRPEALAILSRQAEAALSRQAEARLAPASAPIARTWPPVLPVQAPQGPQPPLQVVEEDDALEEPREAPSGPLTPRLLTALLAIGSGITLQVVLERALGRSAVIHLLSASPDRPDEWWRLVTAGFLHSGFAHLAMNGLFALILGVVLFGTHGFGAVLATWVTSSAAGLLAEQSLSPATHILGASAGIYGLIGLWWGGQSERAKRAVLPRRERWRAAGIIVLLIPGALTPFTSTGSGVAVLAHLFGFLVGRALAWVFHRRFHDENLERTRIVSHVGFAFGALLIVGAWLAAIPSLTQR